MFDELIRQVKRKRGKTSLASESRRHASKKTGQARVRPQLVQVTEEFRYHRSLGKWQPDIAFATGAGAVSVSTSIDDNTSLAKPGRLDMRSLQIADPERQRILGSFLTFHNHSRTDLEQLISLDGGFDSIRMEAPAGAGRPAGQAPELGLQKSHQHATYRVDQPTRLPIEVALNVAEGEPGDPSLDHDLYLLLDIKLYLPNVGKRPRPRLAAVALDWPWLSEPDESIEGWSIERHDYENPHGFDIKRFLTELSTAYDTTGQAIVCSPPDKGDTWFIPGPHSDDAAELPFFFSLLIRPKRPLQLIDSYHLNARVFITFDSLVSGTEVQVYDATGYRDDTAKITTTTLLRAGIELDLDHAMAQRWSGQRNSLRFPGVQPSPEVIETIKAMIAACDYRVVDEWAPGGRNRGEIPKENDFDRDIEVTRSIAGKRVEATLEVRGRSRSVNRTLRGSGGPRLKEDLRAGDVDIKILGEVEGDHRLLTSELNTLHDNLRSRLSTFAEA